MRAASLLLLVPAVASAAPDAYYLVREGQAKLLASESATLLGETGARENLCLVAPLADRAITEPELAANYLALLGRISGSAKKWTKGKVAGLDVSFGDWCTVKAPTELDGPYVSRGSKIVRPEKVIVDSLKRLLASENPATALAAMTRVVEFSDSGKLFYTDLMHLVADAAELDVRVQAVRTLVDVKGDVKTARAIAPFFEEDQPDEVRTAVFLGLAKIGKRHAKELKDLVGHIRTLRDAVPEQDSDLRHAAHRAYEALSAKRK